MNNSSQKKGVFKNEKFKEYRDEYLRKYKGMSDFFDAFFSSHEKYHEAVNNPDKQASKKALEEALKYAEASKSIDEQKGGLNVQQLGIDNLIDVIKKALDELNNNKSDSKNQNT